MAFVFKALEYTGDDAADRDLPMGFDSGITPLMAWVIRPAASATMAYKLWTTVDESKNSTSSTVDTVTGIRELIDGGIKIGKTGGASRTNHAGETYQAFAFAADDATTFAVGTYTGDGSDDVNIAVGFVPDFVMVSTRNDAALYYWITDKGGDNAANLFDVNGAFTVNRIQGTHSNGFQVGSLLHLNNIVYYWAAFKDATGSIKTGKYTGDGNTGRTVSTDTIGVVSDDRMMLVKGENTSNSALVVGHSEAGATSFEVGIGFGIDRISDVTKTNAFDIEDDTAVNDDTQTYYFLMAQTGPGAPSGLFPSGSFIANIGRVAFRS